MTRYGGAVSDEYIATMKLKGAYCKDQMRHMITHDGDFRHYYKQNQQKLRNVVNKAAQFGDGAPTGVTHFKMRKLRKEYESIERIKAGTAKVNASQERALVKAYS